MSVIGRISEFQITIASAVEEQTATNITGVADSAQSTSRGVSEAQQTTAELARMSSDLTDLVHRFRY